MKAQLLLCGAAEVAHLPTEVGVPSCRLKSAFRMLLALLLCLDVWTATAAVSEAPPIGGAATNVVNINNINVNQQFVTNQFVTTQYTTNQFVTFNYATSSFVTNLYVSQSFITNLNVQKLTVQNLFSQNNYFTTNAFPSSTNSFDLTNSYQFLATFTSASVTNLGSVSNNYVGLGMLMVSNSAATNITLTITVPNATAVGAQTAAQVTIAPQTMAWARFLTYGNVFTNYADDTFAGALATTGYVNTSTNGFLRAPVANGSLANSSITIQGAAVALGGTTLAAGSTPSFAGDNFTNLSYIIKTNNGGGNALVSGAPGTPLTCILTNITGDTTLGAMTFWTAGMSVIPIYVSCSGGANKILKFPANFQGAGDLYGIDLNGTGETITNGEAKWYEVRCIYGVKTNVFHSATK